jgi:hypothetical protein
MAAWTWYPKTNMSCGLTSAGVFWTFFFLAKTVAGAVYHHMIKNFAMPQVPDRYTFQQDETPPHYWIPVTESLNQHFAGRWIGHSSPIPWPPWSPDLTTLGFFLWDTWKTLFFIPKSMTCLICVIGLQHSIIHNPGDVKNTQGENEYWLDIRCTTQWHIQRSTNITVNLVTLFMFHDKLLVCIFIKNKIIIFLHQLLSFQALCIVHCSILLKCLAILCIATACCLTLG